MTDRHLPKNIPEQKLKAFSIGTMGKRTLSKRELEELRKKEQEEAAAHAFQEFVETFQEAPINGSKIWVKAGTYDAGARKEDTREKGKLYKPQSRLPSIHENLSSAERAQEYARLLAIDRKPERLGKKKMKDKSNLESFKEELRQIQEEREERHKYKGGMKTIDSDLDLLVKPGETGSFDNGDPTTTNLYLGNLNPKITEQQLMEVFGKYGPLASIKIMWPRSDEEKARGRNCGFVAFMNRKDGERALRNLNGKDVMMYEMKLGWGKSVIIPPHPIYIPPALLELSMPPPPSGLPFNAQPHIRDRNIHPQTPEELDKILSRAIVKVVMPTDRNLLMLIHRMVEFVIREGPLFEAMIMNREINSPLFRFLFENQSPAHIYYRWKLFSMMQGDSQKEWLYLVSDILHNCGVKINNASYYRRAFEHRLLDIMKNLNDAYRHLEGRLKAEGFKVRVIKTLKAWEDSAIYTRDFLHKLHNAFLGLEEALSDDNEVESDPRVEGVPIEEDTDFEDGVPMDGAVLLKGVMKHNLRQSSPTALISHDIDGIPLSGELYDEMSDKHGSQDSKDREAPSGFIPSKWETIDPDQVEAQAMTTSKWDQLEGTEDNSIDSSHNDVQDSSDTTDSRNLTEERRSKLREIEVKAMQYQDELESGQRALKSGWTVSQQVEHYRRKLLRKTEKEKMKEKEPKFGGRHSRDWSERSSSRRSSSPEDIPPYYKDASSLRRKKRSRSSSDSSTDPKGRHRSRTRYNRLRYRRNIDTNISTDRTYISAHLFSLLHNYVFFCSLFHTVACWL
ncbi:uncharacterized protein CBL_14269 [Carabus blaptoides fortunei]